MPALGRGQDCYDATVAIYQGQTRYGRKTSGGGMSVREPAGGGVVRDDAHAVVVNQVININVLHDANYLTDDRNELLVVNQREASLADQPAQFVVLGR